MKKSDNFNAMQWLTENKITTQSKLNENNTEASELLSLLASSEIKKYMDKLSDTLEDADFMRVKKLYDGLYTELKKHE
jgi:hypothetical protein